MTFLKLWSEVVQHKFIWFIESSMASIIVDQFYEGSINDLFGEAANDSAAADWMVWMADSSWPIRACIDRILREWLI